jgi:exosortase A-associated hydrolase 1
MKAGTGLQERALLLPCEGERLLAVLTLPTDHTPRQTSGVLVVVGGPQYRAGSHRQFVQLARALAGKGFPVLRFDARGMGDSTGALHDFLHQSPDIGAAIDALCRTTGVERVLLWGLCDGASAALLYLHERADPRVAGLCLLNPWVRSAQSLARTHVRHYYRQRLMEPAFWRKLVRGGVALKAARDLLGNLRAARGGRGSTTASLSFQDRMAAAWRAFAGPIQLVLSGNDLTAREFVEFTRQSPAWQGLATDSNVTQLEMPDADHTFSGPGHKEALEQAVLQWWLQQSPSPVRQTA